jgi:hypothetical protein
VIVASIIRTIAVQGITTQKTAILKYSQSFAAVADVAGKALSQSTPRAGGKFFYLPC